MHLPGRIALYVTCLTADMCLTADPGVANLIPARSHTFLEIDHEIISTPFLLSSPDSRRVVVNYKRKMLMGCKESNQTNKTIESMCTKYWLAA